MRYGEIPCNSAALEKVIAKINGDNFVGTIFLFKEFITTLGKVAQDYIFIFELFSYSETVTKSCSEKRAVTKIFRNFVEKQFWNNSDFRMFNVAVNS